MKKFRIIINQSISILMLVIYLFGSSSILLPHNHDDDHDHHDHHDHHDQVLPICKNSDSNSFNISDCSHESHILTLEESCTICDHFSNCKPEILNVSDSADLQSFTVTKIQLFASFYLIDSSNTQNKSPPFII